MSEYRQSPATTIDLPSFQCIDYSIVDIAHTLNNFISVGSKKNRVAITDLTIISRVKPDATQPITLDSLITGGTRLFDAILYFSLPEANRPSIGTRPLPSGATDPTKIEIAEAVAYLYFNLITRANVPGGRTSGNYQPPPKFLTTEMGMGEDPQTYMDKIASFDLNKLDHSWIKHVKYGIVDQKMRNRFGLGVAGYRNLSPFAQFVPDNNPSAEEMAVRQVLLNLRNKGPLWDVHPVTRTTAFLMKVINFNINLNNLMVKLYTPETLEQMKTLKKIYAVPTYDPSHVEYLTWTDETFREFNDKISFDPVSE